jgi:hypothetical protein
MDAADEKARELFSDATYLVAMPKSESRAWRELQTVVAAALRERDERIAALEREVRELTDLEANLPEKYNILEAENERLRAFAEKVGLLGILDHERNGVLQCESCCDDARWLRQQLAKLGGRCAAPEGK